MAARPPLVTCGGCLARRRTVALWYLPRSGAPVRHVGLPAGWSVAQGYPFCPRCAAAARRRASRRRSTT